MRYLMITFTLLLVPTMTPAQKIKVDYNKDVDFTQFKSYSWGVGIPARNPYINLMLIESIERDLAQKGFTKVDKGGDLLLRLAVAVDVDLQVTHGGWGNTGSSLQTGIPVANQPWDVRKGTLVLDLEDSKSGTLVWHGQARDTLKHAPTTDLAKDAQRVEKQVKKAVEKLMKKFPPKTKR